MFCIILTISCFDIRRIYTYIVVETVLLWAVENDDGARSILSENNQFDVPV